MNFKFENPVFPYGNTLLVVAVEEAPDTVSVTVTVIVNVVPDVIVAGLVQVVWYPESGFNMPPDEVVHLY